MLQHSALLLMTMRYALEFLDCWLCMFFLVKSIDIVTDVAGCDNKGFGFCKGLVFLPDLLPGS